MPDTKPHTVVKATDQPTTSTVTMHFPVRVKINDHQKANTIHEYEPGVREVPEHLADTVWLKAHGVKRVSKQAAEAIAAQDSLPQDSAQAAEQLAQLADKVGHLTADLAAASTANEALVQENDKLRTANTEGGNLVAQLNKRISDLEDQLTTPALPPVAPTPAPKPANVATVSQTSKNQGPRGR